jgi:hypothetical protein
MKSILTGLVAAVVIAIGAYAVLDGTFQKDASTAFTTEGVRL